MKRINYLRIGGDTVLRSDSIIGIFDMDNTTTSKHTMAFLSRVEREGRLVNLAADIPAGYVVTDEGVYFTQLSSRTLKGRFLV